MWFFWKMGWYFLYSLKIPASKWIMLVLLFSKSSENIWLNFIDYYYLSENKIIVKKEYFYRYVKMFFDHLCLNTYQTDIVKRIKGILIILPPG